MAELPTGTVTFLFTDIEGSTKLLHELGDGYADVLAEHRWILRDEFAAHDGVEVDTQGDAFFVAFARATDAASAALDSQRALGQGPVRVRMGIHTGEPVRTDEGYVGMDVHRAARIAAAGHGGQVLVSQATRNIVGDGFDLQDLGAHRLKDLLAPEHIFQLGPAEFPPLKTLHQTNLPIQSSPLVGRENELGEAALLLDANRVVTFVGPGGSGKTRLALQVAAEQVDAFPNGVFWVPLQGVADPEHVLPAISQAVGASNGPGEFLRGRKTLLLLDNLEHVLEAAPALTELLRETTDVKVLATSREPLRIAGEQRFPVEPLPETDAVTLFVERAREVDPGFEPSPAVAGICKELDGLPLALELAAARVSLLSAEELLDRLERALPILTGGARDAPARQQTLRATIDWSYELLSETEQRLFRGLSVLAGSFDVDAAIAVCEAELDTLQSLVDKSLVRRWGTGRLGMLETIHEFARERLSPEELEHIGRRHAEHFLEVALSGNFTADARGEQDSELGRLELPNFRAAFAWALEHGETELALRIAVALEGFLEQTAPFDAIAQFEALLPRADEVDPLVRAAAFRAYGGALYLSGQFDPGMVWQEKSLDLYRSQGDEWGEAHMMHRLASNAARTGDYAQAQALSEEALAIARRLGDPRAEALAMRVLGEAEANQGNTDEAIELLRSAASLAEEGHFPWWQGGSLMSLAETALGVGRLDDAHDALFEGLPILARLGDRLQLVWGLAMLARTLAARGHEEAGGVCWGALEAEEDRGPIGQWETARHEYEQELAPYEGAAFEQGRDRGRQLSVDEAVAYALSVN